MSERALVLGSGGASGTACVIGGVAGLFDAGKDVTGADVASSNYLQRPATL